MTCRTVAFISLVAFIVSWITGSDVGSWIAFAFLVATEQISYQYIIKETMRVSSGKKEVEKVQEQGYRLIGETEQGTSHVLLFEKASAE